MFTNLVCVSILVNIMANPIMTNISQAKPFYVKDMQIEAEVFQNQFIKFMFADVNFEISGRVLQSNTQVNSDIVDDYQKNPANYADSPICTISRSNISMGRIYSYENLFERIKAYYYDDNISVYVATNSQILLFTLGLDRKKLPVLNLEDSPFFDSEFIPTNPKFFKINSNLYLADGKTLRLITTSIINDRKELKLTNVQGFIALGPSQVLLKAVYVVDELVVLGTMSMTRYTFTDQQTLKLVEFPFASSPQAKQLSFVDIQFVNDKVYLLEKTTGIYILSSLSGVSPVIHEFKYGQHRRFQIIQSTIQVFFELDKQLYVAQFLEQPEGLYLNRFYNQISGFRTVDFIDNKAIFVGEDSVMLIGHSINRQLLLNGISSKQNRYTYGGFGIQEMEIIRDSSNKTHIQILGFTDFKILIVELIQSPPEISCDMTGMQIGTKSLLVQFNSSSCGSFNWKDWEATYGNLSSVYCNIKQGVKIQIKRGYQRKASLLFSITVTLIMVVGIFFIVGFAAKWRNRMSIIMNRIKAEIERRRAAAAAASSTHGMKAI